MPREEISTPEIVSPKQGLSYEEKVLQLMERWFPEEEITIIDPESQTARENQEAVKTVNTLFNDLGGTLFTAVDVAIEKWARLPEDSPERSKYQQVIHELRIIGEGVNAFHNNQIVYPPEQNKQYYRNIGRKVTKIGFNGRFVGDDGKEYNIEIFIRKQPYDTLEGSKITRSAQARFKFQISDQNNQVIAAIRIDPGDFGRVVYDLDTHTLRKGEVDLSEAGQAISETSGKPTHHFPHPSLKLTREQFGQALEVLDQHIRAGIERNSLKRAA